MQTELAVRWVLACICAYVGNQIEEKCTNTWVWIRSCIGNCSKPMWSLWPLSRRRRCKCDYVCPPSPSSELDLKQPFKWTLIYGPTTSVAFIAETIFGGIRVAPTLLKIEPWSNVYVRWMDRTRSSDRTEKGERKNETLFGAWTMGKIELSSLLSLGSPTHVTDAKQEQFFSR